MPLLLYEFNALLQMQADSWANLSTLVSESLSLNWSQESGQDSLTAMTKATARYDC